MAEDTATADLFGTMSELQSKSRVLHPDELCELGHARAAPLELVEQRLATDGRGADAPAGVALKNFGCNERCHSPYALTLLWTSARGAPHDAYT